MVTAGVYMVSRCHVLFNLAPTSLMVVAVIGCLTAFFAGTIALVQNDIKRVLAYSTVSQLGYMFLAAGVGAYTAAIFHLMTHAFFKALLFLGAGSVIHALSEEQDIRNMGGLKSIMPTTYRTFVIASLAIAGVPPLAGFMSKDEILYSTFTAGHGPDWYTALWALGILTAFMTAFYMFRLVYKTFHGQSRMDPEVKKHAHESPPVITVPLSILAFLSVVGGFLGIPILLKYNVMHNWMGPLFEAIAEHGGEATHAAHSLLTEIGLMGVSILVAVGGILLALSIVLRKPQVSEDLRSRFGYLYELLLNKWWVDELYDAVVVRPLWAVSGVFWTGIDGKGIDGTLHGIAAGAQGSGGLLSRLQTGFVQNYALSMAAGVAVLLIWSLL
jgi:NADH-quinone oxidoreductase subunit L